MTCIASRTSAIVAPGSQVTTSLEPSFARAALNTVESGLYRVLLTMSGILGLVMPCAWSRYSPTGNARAPYASLFSVMISVSDRLPISASVFSSMIATAWTFALSIS